MIPARLLRNPLALLAVGMALAPLGLMLGGCGGKKTEGPKLIGSGRHDMPVKTFRSLAPREPKVLTLFCGLSDFYIHGDDRAEFYSFSLKDEPGDWLYGYAAKGSPLGERLVGILRGGKEHWLTLEVQCVEESPRFVTISRIVE